MARVQNFKGDVQEVFNGVISLMAFILPPDDYSLELKSGLSPVAEFDKMSEFYTGLNNFGKL